MAPGRRAHEGGVIKRVLELSSSTEKPSQRAIVRILAREGKTISRSSVQDILNGRHRQKKPSTGRLSHGERILKRSQRCKVCGNKLKVFPCRICRTIAAVEAGPRQVTVTKRQFAEQPQPRPLGSPHPLALQLKGEFARRYEEKLSGKKEPPAAG